MVSIIADEPVYSRIAQAMPEVPALQRAPPLGTAAVTGRSEAAFLQVGVAKGGVDPAAIEALIRGAPWLAVIPVVTGDADPGRIMAWGALGVTRVLPWPPEEGGESLRRAVPDLLCSALGDVVFRRLATADPVIRDGISWAAATAHQGPTLAGLARRLGASPRQLRRRLAAAGGITPGEILTLGRVIQGMYRLRISTVSVERVALIVGFASASGLRRALLRHAGVRPSELREGFLMRRTLEALLQTVVRGPRLLH